MYSFSNSKWFQLSLYRCFQFVSLLALLVGYYCWSFAEVRTEWRKEQDAIKQFKGTIGADWDAIRFPSPHLAWLYNADELYVFDRVVSVHCSLDDPELNLSVFTELRTADIGGSATDKRIRHLCSCKHLEYLNISDSQVTGVTLDGLPRSLTSLHVNRTSISSDGWESLAMFSGLREFHASGSTLTSTEAQILLPALPQLRSLSLANCDINDSAFSSTLVLEHLQHVDLKNTSVSDGAVRVLSRSKELEWCDLSNTQVTVASLEVLEQMTNLQDLVLTGTDIKRADLDGYKGLLDNRGVSVDY